jgi:hypothetical protein
MNRKQRQGAAYMLALLIIIAAASMAMAATV